MSVEQPRRCLHRKPGHVGDWQPVCALMRPHRGLKHRTQMQSRLTGGGFFEVEEWDNTDEDEE